MARRAATKILGAPWWLWAALGGAVAFLLSQKDTIMVYGRKALDAANREFFALSLPSYARPYADLILRVAAEEGVDPFLIFALGDRESNWGTQLSPAGPTGTGDNGHGHGLMQIDSGSWGAWLAANAWWDPYVNVKKGVQIFKAKLAFLSSTQPVAGLATSGRVYVGTSAAAVRKVTAGTYADPRPLEGDLLLSAALAAYNTGEGNVLVSLATGVGEDATTAGNDYAANVSQRMSDAAGRFDQIVPAEATSTVVASDDAGTPPATIPADTSTPTWTPPTFGQV